MAENSWPFENTDTTETQYTKLMRCFADNGVLTGLALTTAGGMGVSLATGSALVQGWFYENTTARTLTIGASNASNTRLDYIVLKVDTVANTITALVKAGTATAGGGTLPALTQTLTVWEYPLHVVTVTASAINLAESDLASRSTQPSLRINPYANSEGRDRLNLVGVGSALGVNTGTKELEFYNGSVWSVLNPAATWASLSGKPATFAPSVHTHDDRYYTETEVGSFLSGKADSSHTHDDRYYTETEVSSFLSGKSSNGHSHVIADVTSLQNTLNGKVDAATLGDYAPKANPTFTGTVTGPNFVGKLNGVKISVQSAAPVAPSTNDLWFW